MKRKFKGVLWAGCGLIMFAACAAAYEQLGGAFDGSPDDASIRYDGPADEAVARLNRKIEDGSVKLKFDPQQGSALRSVLEALHVPVESQIVAMARTSVQQHIIGPANPRTLYFNDSVIVGYVRGGFIEAAAQDSKQGMMFYTLGLDGKTTFRREDSCLSCHLAYDTMGVPGALLRSVFPQPDGNVLPGTGRYATDHRSPLEQRYGGWFVTGEDGPARHMGNAFFTDPDKADFPTKGLLLGKIGGLDSPGYLSPYSDVVALQVFDHQMHMMNLLTRVGWEARWAKAEQPETVAARMRNAAEELVDYLLFVDEAPFQGRTKGSSGFAEKFAAEGPFDQQGRSLRQFDLEHRLMRYPCSYMIYSEAFDHLPGEAKDAVYRRLWTVLSGKATEPKYARLSSADRQNVVEILRQTKTDLPAYFAEGKPSAAGIDWKILRPGDVILSHSSEHVQADLYDPVYTHAALDLGTDESGAPLILEALSADLAEGLGEVRALPLKRTWLYRDAVRVDVYRPAQPLSAEQRTAIVKFGREVAARHPSYRSTASFSDLYAAWLLWDPSTDRPRNPSSFDAALERLREQKESMTSFDCATLIWRAYAQAGVDLSEPNRVELGGRLSGLSKAFLARVEPDFLTVDTLYRSGKLVKVNR